MERTLGEMLREQAGRTPDAPALRTRVDGTWSTQTWADWYGTSLAVAAALADLGVSRGERVGLVCGTRREWAEIDFGVLLAGAVLVPLHPQTTAAHLADALSRARCTVVFVEDPVQLEKLFAAGGRALEGVRRVVWIDARRSLERPDAQRRIEVGLADVLPRGESSRVTDYGALVAAGRRAYERDEAAVTERIASVAPDDEATVVFTSGTTGEARGVVLTHANLRFECERFGDELGVSNVDSQLLVLPLAHIFGHVMLLAAARVGACTAFASSPLRALDEAREVDPTFIAAVPRVFEKIRAGIERRIAHEGPLRRRLAAAALAAGRDVSRLRQSGRIPGPVAALKHRLATAAMFEQVRGVFGKRLRFAISGGAPLARDVAEWFHACDVLVLEGYGLTETSAASHLNRPHEYRIGSVGRPIPGVECRIGDDGEVLVRGGNVTRGYLDDPDATRGALDADGWLRTGDLGAIDPDGYLAITGRRKDLIVTAGGKNVAPQHIEALLRSHAIVDEAAVAGDARPYLVALLALDQAVVESVCRAHGSAARDRGAQLADPAVLAAVAHAVAAVNAALEPYQQVHRWAIVPDGFTVEQGDTTVTAKLRRSAVLERHAARLHALYGGGHA